VVSALLQHFARNAKEPLVLVRGEGPHVWDDRGRQHIDGLSALYCAQLGYSYGDEFAAAAAEQMRTLPFATNWSVASPPALELAEALARRSGMGHAFFTSGGSEAVEAAWKIARQVHLARGEPGRTKAVARRIAYHGVTLGALSFTGVAPYKEPFGRPPIDVVHAATTNAYRPEVDDPLADVERAVEEAGPDAVAVIIAEPVQNAGGCLVAPDGYWEGLRSLADRVGALLVADEVITGFGRIGDWFATRRMGVVPDLITCAKGITSAYAPMGAVLVRGDVAAPLRDPGRTLLHGITFGGHPVSAAVALRNIEIFERDGVLENVRALEGHLADRLRSLLSLELVGDVRGAGFFWALELVGEDGRRFDAAERERLLRGVLPRLLYEAGVIARCDDRGDSVLQIAPPLVSDQALLDELVDRLGDVLARAAAEIRAPLRAA